MLQRYIKENGDKHMRIELMTSTHQFYNDVKDYALFCNWRGGASLADKMEKEIFKEWERVVAIIDKNKVIGFCTITKSDNLIDSVYTPFIGYIFVDEKYRGKRVSQTLIEYSSAYLKTLGFDRVHIISDHENLYEKYGFEVIDEIINHKGNKEKIYVMKI